MKNEVKELRKKRKALGLTQAQLAKLARVLPSTYAAIEGGYVALNAETARQVWDALARVEGERQSEMTVTERKLLERIQQLENDHAALKHNHEVEAAKSYVETCSRLPWMKAQLPSAKEQLAQRLAQKTAQAQSLRNANLDDPIVKELLDSLYQEIEELEKQNRQNQEISSVIEGISGLATLEFCDAVMQGDTEEANIFREWKATGKCDLKLKMSVQKVEDGE